MYKWLTRADNSTDTTDSFKLITITLRLQKNTISEVSINSNLTWKLVGYSFTILYFKFENASSHQMTSCFHVFFLIENLRPGVTLLTFSRKKHTKDSRTILVYVLHFMVIIFEIHQSTVTDITWLPWKYMVLTYHIQTDVKQKNHSMWNNSTLCN